MSGGSAGALAMLRAHGHTAPWAWIITGVLIVVIVG